MTNPTDTKQQYEEAILQQLIKNSERLVTAENSLAQVKSDIAQMKSDITTIQVTTPKIESVIFLLKWIGGGVAAILLSVIASFVYSFVS